MKKSKTRNEVQQLMKGVMNIQFTPFKSYNEIDEDALRSNTRFMIDEGIVAGKGVQVIGGSNGEGFSLSDKEYELLIRVVVEEAKGEVPIVVGCCRPATAQVIKIAKMAEQYGADAIMVLPPFYYPNPSDDIIVDHFKAIADATEIGIMIYNNHMVCGKDLSLDCIGRLAEIEHIIALKEISSDMRKLRQIMLRFGDRFPVNSNTYRSAMPLDYQIGIVGYNHYTGNYSPKAALEIDSVARSGDINLCHEMFVRYLEFYNYVFTGDMYYATAMGKEMARIVGRPMGDCERLPLKRPNLEQREKLEKLMKIAEILGS